VRIEESSPTAACVAVAIVQPWACSSNKITLPDSEAALPGCQRSIVPEAVDFSQTKQLFGVVFPVVFVADALYCTF
jgi:hypothetical protein